MPSKDQFYVPQKAVIMNGDKYLILKRSTDSVTYPDHWDFPGGKIEHGEEVEESLIREVKEETDLDVKVIRPIFAFQKSLNRPNIFIVYLCEKVSGKIELSHEHTEYKWATREEILKEEKIEDFLRAFLENQK
ncbi:MAG: NUDIX domain-containing protein [Nanoarchaeota archaeon]|nr:NUDIX domain-containing protein [Nanoarchaeota archaeon]MBU1135099.1 NUDIX domain-containing protein [Nanoarchaeota archaeon]MBU2519937.1 NUDIX domain-containing protein [Nanoarchaeota archaeon]